LAATHGQLIRAKDADPVYLVVHGKLSHIPDPATFDYLDFDRNSIEEVDDLSSYEIMEPLPSMASRLTEHPPSKIDGTAFPSSVMPKNFKIGVRPLVILLLLAVAVIIFVPQVFSPTAGLSAYEHVQAVAAIRTAIVQLLAAVVVAAGFYFTLQSVRLSRSTLISTMDNQYSERYAKGLDMIGMSNSPDVRYGAILALTRLASTSAQDRGNVAVFFSQLLRTDGLSRVSTGGLNEPPAKRTDSEIVGLLDGIGTCLNDDEALEVSLATMKIADLRDVKLRLRRTYLAGAHVTRSQMPFSNLTMSRMAGAHFADVEFRSSTLAKIMGRGATFRECDLSWCDLREAVFICADLRDASLVGSALDQAIFTGADLRGANLRSTNLAGANLNASDLRGAKADKSTKFPPGLDPVDRGVLYA
jgi:uncharacterized protein YjbI with pentapeptide repeats